MDVAIALPLSVFTLMLISVGVFLLARKLNLPYTVLLVFVGVLLVPIARTETFSYIGYFHLTPEILFFIFLPVLIFEAAYNMSIPKVVENFRAISLLAIGGLLISVFFIAYSATWILGFTDTTLPFMAVLLFGAIISATDPVAVLALFKEYGAPRRLALLFEGESLFNDGTAVALFVIVLAVIESGIFTAGTVISGVGLFAVMIVTGVIFGLVMGGAFSKVLQYTESEHVHITLTMLVAHLTFLLAELISHVHPLGIHISSIIATVVAAMVVGNYGRYKMSPRTEEYLQQFWDYFAFVTNSLVFLLLGLMFAEISVNLTELIIPLVVIIAVVIIARIVSVYGLLIPFNVFAPQKQRIPMRWQHLMAWGSLRGALAITMALLLPEDLAITGWALETDPRDFILALTIGCIYFTLFIKATTMPALMSRLKIDTLHPIEEVEYWEGRAHLYATALVQAMQLHDREHIDDAVFERVHKRLNEQYAKARKKLQAHIDNDEDVVRRVLKIYAIGVEKRALKNLYAYNEISERAYKKVLGKLAIQRSHLEDGSNDRLSFENIFARDLIEHLIALFRRMLFLKKYQKTDSDRFMYYRALMLLARDVIEHLTKLSQQGNVHVFKKDAAFREVLETYQRFEHQSEEKMRAVLAENAELEKEYEHLVCCEVLRIEEEALDDLLRTEMITPKLRKILRQEIRRDLA